MGSDGSQEQSSPWPCPAGGGDLWAVLEMPTVDPSLRMEEDDDLNSCPWHRAARQEKPCTQRAEVEETRGRAEFSFFLSSISLHPVVHLCL